MTKDLLPRIDSRQTGTRGYLIVCGALLFAGGALFPSSVLVRAGVPSCADEEKKKSEGDKKLGDKGEAKFTEREKRMLRWHLKSSAANGPQYLAELHGLGAVLAIPVKEEKGKDPVYKVIRDLRPGKGVLEDEDLTKMKRIYWIDDKESSVKDVMDALGLRLPKTPARFVAFMPKKLEDHLFRLERTHIEKVLRKPYDEDRIEETVFRAVASKVVGKDTVTVELVSVTLKK